MEEKPTKKDNPGWKNLIPMKKGETRNPYGRPKGVENWATIFKRFLKVVPKMDKDTMTFFGMDDLPPRLLKDSRTLQQIIAIRLLSKASNGDLKAIEMLVERMEGKPLATVAQIDMTPKPLFDEENENSPFGFAPVQLADAIAEPVEPPAPEPMVAPPSAPVAPPEPSVPVVLPTPAPSPVLSPKERRRLKRLKGG